MGLMQQVDAHSKKVARQHYQLTTPADDALLAKALVHAMLGEPVPWPAAAELDDKADQVDRRLKDAEGQLDLTMEDGLTDEDDEDDDELDYWDGAEAFGLEKKPLLAIKDGTCKPAGHCPSALPAAAASSTGSSAAAAAAAALAAPPPAKMPRGSKTKEGAGGPSSSSSSAAASVTPAVCEPPVKKSRHMAPAEKAWLEGYHQLHCAAQGVPATTVPEKKWFAMARESGIESGHLNQYVTTEVLRSHLKSVCLKATPMQDAAEMNLD
jgi:hypothetical protein